MTTPFVPCPNTAQSTMQYLSNGQKCVNVLHFLGSSPWTSASLTALNSYLVAWETSHAAPVRCNNTEMTGVYSVDLADQFGAFAQTAAIITGGETDPPVPNNVTLAFKLGTPLRGRSFRGRLYWVGLTQAQLTADRQQVASATATTIGGIIDLIRTGAIPNGGQLVVRSIRHNGTFRTTGVMTPCSGVTLTDFFIDSQRRRLPSHNIHR